MKPLDLTTLTLPVPRTADLIHVHPTHFASALGNDSTRIFEFVRDHIRFEVYTGLLRGPRGTLLALAGNSADRAALLAAMLEKAGQRVRFAQGRLAAAEARDLVGSMWREKQEIPRETSTQGLSSVLESVLERYPPIIRRDFDLIREQLRELGRPRKEAAPSFDSLIAEATEHYWLQRAEGNRWVDLDPSFPDAAPGRAYTRVDRTFDTLPDALAHQVRISVHVEEYAEGALSRRELLKYTARATELSGVAVFLAHFPENWSGPAGSIQQGIAAAIQDTGRVKPVLMVGDRIISGEAFFQRPPSGIGSIGNLLRGQGSRNPLPLAAAEFLSVEFLSPGATATTVVREVFDLIGPARRTAGRPLTDEELQSRIEQKDTVDIRKAFFSLFFTTGRMDAAHISGGGEPAPTSSPTSQEPDLSTILGRLSTVFAMMSDTVAGRVGQPSRAIALFYHDSPRLTIMDLTQSGNSVRLSLDLRRDHMRAVALGPEPETIVLARILRGVIEGTLERMLLELALPARAGGPDELAANMGTSTLFELAAGNGVKSLLLPRDRDRLGTLPDNAQARVAEEIARGYVVVAPERSISIRGMPRYAWWRINPVSGETTAVTDEGLHQEYVVQTSQKPFETVRVKIYYVGTFARVLLVELTAAQVAELGGIAAVLRMLRGPLWRHAGMGNY
jgi:hypothetical protein